MQRKLGEHFIQANLREQETNTDISFSTLHLVICFTLKMKHEIPRQWNHLSMWDKIISEVTNKQWILVLS